MFEYAFFTMEEGLGFENVYRISNHVYSDIPTQIYQPKKGVTNTIVHAALEILGTSHSVLRTLAPRLLAVFRFLFPLSNATALA